MAKANRDEDIASTLEAMDAADLIELSRSIDQEIGRRMAEKRKEAIATLQELAADCEMSVEELCDLASGSRVRTTLPPKYRHPKHRSWTWSGRGRRPDWLLRYISQGGALEDLRI